MGSSDSGKFAGYSLYPEMNFLSVSIFVKGETWDIMQDLLCEWAKVLHKKIYEDCSVKDSGASHINFLFKKQRKPSISRVDILNFRTH